MGRLLVVVWLFLHAGPVVDAWKVFRGTDGLSNDEPERYWETPANLEPPLAEPTGKESFHAHAYTTTTPAPVEAAAASVIWQTIRAIVLYKPPVGILIVLLVLRLLWKLFHRQHNNDQIEDVLVTKHPRAAILDHDDRNYHVHGGVEHLRRRLCLFGLFSGLEQTKTIQMAQEALGLFHHHDRYSYLQAMIPACAALQEAVQSEPSPREQKNRYFDPIHRVWNTLVPTSENLFEEMESEASCSLSDSQIETLLQISHWTCQVRLTDAFLRLCRDSLLKTTHRLARLVEYWQRRIGSHKTAPLLFRLGNDLETDQLRLSLVQAAYEEELKRLGEITKLLTERPDDLPEAALTRAIHYTRSRSCRNQSNEQKMQWPFRWLSTYSFRFSEGRGLLSIRKYNESDAFIDGPAAVAILLQENAQWVDQAQQWTLLARQTLGTIIHDIVQSSPDLPQPYSLEEFINIREEFSSSWCDEDNWRSALKYAANLSNWQRVGEGHKVRLRDVFGLKNMLAQLDFFQIPSSLFFIYTAFVIHNRLVIPYWSPLQREVMEATKRSSEIFEQRVSIPLRDIYNDIMNKDNSGIMSEMFVLDAEELVLDHMLRELNLGDGTPSSRQTALQKANDQYEEDFSKGVLTNMVRGRLLQLLLVQMQQLKVGLLSALDTIDVLMRGNRIHFKVLAAVPFVVLATFGTRYFFRALYNIRAKDIRPVTIVHGEMQRYLERIEHLLVAASDSAERRPDVLSQLKHWRRLGQTQSGTSMELERLGELSLNLHRYLVLLEFSSPPFPAKNCDQIRSELTNLLGNLKNYGPDRHLQLLKLSKEKHQELLKRL